MFTYFTKKERTCLRYMVSAHRWNLIQKEVETDEEEIKRLQKIKMYDSILKKLAKSEGDK